VLSVSSTIGRHPIAHARAAGCLWVAAACWLFLFLLTVGAVVPIDASALVVPLVGPPLLLAALVFLAGHRRPALFLSVIAGFGDAAVGIVNYLRAEEFERQNPGAMEASGGFISILFVLLVGCAALWSLSAFALLRRRGDR
jgi:hypothetical protein